MGTGTAAFPCSARRRLYQYDQSLTRIRLRLGTAAIVGAARAESLSAQGRRSDRWKMEL
jgi:hypothetical protein